MRSTEGPVPCIGSPHALELVVRDVKGDESQVRTALSQKRRQALGRLVCTQ